MNGDLEVTDNHSASPTPYNEWMNFGSKCAHNKLSIIFNGL